MARTRLTGWNKNRLRALLLAFFIALAIPTGILFQQSYSQIKWEAFHNHRLMAEELVTRIDERYNQLVEIENLRAFTDYHFLNIVSNVKGSIVNRSSLSSYPIEINIPGTIGYFQIDPKGKFSTPLLPDNAQYQYLKRYGLPSIEVTRRYHLQNRLHNLLAKNSMVIRPQDRSPARVRPSTTTGQPREMAKKKAANQGLLSFAKELDNLVDTESVAGSMPKSRSSGSSDYSVEQSYAESKPKPVAKPAPSPKVASSQRGIGRVEDLKLKNVYRQRLEEEKKKKMREEEKRKSMERSERKYIAKLQQKRARRKEQSLQFDQALSEMLTSEPLQPRVNLFESEIDALEFAVLDSGHFVLYRKAWHEQQRYIQGMIINANRFLDAIINENFYDSALSQSTSLAIASQGDILKALNRSSQGGYLASSSELQGSLLLHDRLSAPFDQLELIFSVENLPAGPGGTVLIWTAVVLLMIFCGVFVLMYRLGLKQLTLARQQQDFVSAVSHELKTPLTSIRMYGEMLREGWASEEKRKTYYDFIYDESERLTRLINNVLQLARMNRNDLHAELSSFPVSQLLDNLRSKVQNQIDHAGFTLTIDCDESIAQQPIEADADYFSQIIINLVDNAIKFSAKSETKQIDIHCKQLRDGSIQIGLRDYGPGIAKDQMRKIFQLFYRSGDELTRETVGTGIGLALVQQMVQSMRGKIDVVNMEPGAEFRISFPAIGS